MKLVALLALTLLGFSCADGSAYASFGDFKGQPYTVGFDKRTITINGEHSLFISGAIHPPRGTPQMWDGWFDQAKKNGLNMVQVRPLMWRQICLLVSWQVYIFWNYHEPIEGNYDWTGRGNLTDFMARATTAGLFVNLRIGPYVCAEWTYG
jgi:beta-galactosidase GanA